MQPYPDAVAGTSHTAITIGGTGYGTYDIGNLIVGGGTYPSGQTSYPVIINGGAGIIHNMVIGGTQFTFDAANTNQTTLANWQVEGNCISTPTYCPNPGTAVTASGNSTTETATDNAKSALIITPSISTAHGATMTLTLTDSVVLGAGTKVQAKFWNGSNTTTGLTITSVTPATGQVVVVLTNNNGSAALNGTIYIQVNVL